MGNFNVTEYLQYYRSIATLHPSINGFYTMDINEVLGDLRSGMKYPALILNSVNINFVAFNKLLYPQHMEGMFFTVFVIAVAAAEASVAIAIIINI